MDNSAGNKYDVIIVGAGPAGSACALALKDSGLKILLIDKSDFPRDKICGDAIGGRVKRVLKMIDPSLERELHDLPFAGASLGWKLFSPKGDSVGVTFVNPGYVSRRIDFDNWLFEKVKATGRISILTGIEIVAFNTESGDPKLTDKKGNAYTARLIIACDGAHSAILRATKTFETDHRHYSAAVRNYFENIGGIEKNTIEIHLPKKFLPGYFWIFPVSDTLSNVGFGMLSSDISRRKIDLKKAVKEIISESPELAHRFKNSRQLDDFKGFGLPLGGKQRKISGSGFMLCGDAASLIDPLNGEGIGNAMLSGVFAAQQVKDCFDKNNFSAEFISQYDKKIEKHLFPELKKKLFLQKLFNRPWLINILVKASRSNRFLREGIGRRL